MIVVMQQHCNDEAIEHVMTYLKNHGLSGHLSQGVERTVIGVLGAVGPSGTRTAAGGINPEIQDALEGLPSVEQVVIVTKPYKLASREFHPGKYHCRDSYSVCFRWSSSHWRHFSDNDGRAMHC